jgi:hypothetical protein
VGSPTKLSAEPDAPLAAVLPMPPAQPGRNRRAPATLAAAVLLAVVAAASPLDFGFYDFGAWAPLSLAAVVLLVAVLFRGRLQLSRPGLIALASLAGLLALSAASLLWAESRESAWTDTNRLALYCVVLAIALLVIRSTVHARAVLIILGLPGLVSALVACLVFIAGAPHGWFTLGRLNWPLGYINGTAGLLVMTSWPWIWLGESASRRWLRSAALAGAAAILALAVLTQARAIELEALAAAVATLLVAPDRARRALKLLLVLAGVAATLHWTVRPYAVTGTNQTLPITGSAIRGAGLGILASALLVAGAHQLCSLWLGSLRIERRGALLRLSGRALIALVALGLILTATLGSGTIRKQYDAFTQMHTTGLSSGNRLLYAGGFRDDLWRIALDEWVDHPLLGVGAGNYDTYYYALRRNPEYVLQPHSLELQMLAELGIGGVALLLIFLGAIGWGAGSRRLTLSSQDPGLRVAATGIFVAWIAGTSVDWLYDIPGLTITALLAAGVLLAPSPRATEPVTASTLRRRPAQRIAQVAGLAVLALIAASVGRQYAASRYASTGASDVRAGRPAAALRQLTTAEELDPYSLATLYSISAAYARLDDYAGARDALRTAERREPHNYVPPTLLGDLAMLRGYPRVALADYARALKLDPADAQLQSRYARAQGQAR